MAQKIKHIIISMG